MSILIISLAVAVLHRVLLRIITVPIQSQGIITRNNVHHAPPSPTHEGE